ncbi:MAG: hypothetical protein ACI8S6_005249 [Myxococcota bacterium]|jgi:hypothetical protein
MLWTTLALINLAIADVGPSASSQYQLLDSPAAVAQEQAAAVKKTLDSMNMAVRMMAGARVASAVTTCRAYTMEVTDTMLRVQCDARPVVTIRFDGSPVNFTTEKGEAYVVTGSRSGDRVSATFTGPDASQTTLYDFSNNSLAVERTINSAYFGEPLRWSSRYGR